MSATLSYEPYQLPAGLLALAVHVAFFALLYFGFSWQTQPARTISVELWRSLPEDEIAPPAVPRIAETIQPVQQAQTAQPEKLVKPDIALPEKKEKKKVETKTTQQLLVEQKQDKAEQRERIAAEQAAQQASQAARESAEQAARDKAAQDAAINAMVNEFKKKIHDRIKRNVQTIRDVRDDASAEFRVTLLPDGSVLSAELKKSSGNKAYDNAVERAILKSQPLPLPADVAMFNRFRVLLLKFRPVE
jgi:colicin import membrane protein